MRKTRSWAKEHLPATCSNPDLAHVFLPPRSGVGVQTQMGHGGARSPQQGGGASRGQKGRAAGTEGASGPATCHPSPQRMLKRRSPREGRPGGGHTPPPVARDQQVGRFA
ncbi:unnamed protein product [Rangifer tarandus platyrhynchus]|uniref:Uncharacterized protein n=1 Tax=Rangifer tarandus platyrhynchus TaxID=3082113 RepID=A0AC59ZWG8_RANTA